MIYIWRLGSVVTLCYSLLRVPSSKDSFRFRISLTKSGLKFGILLRSGLLLKSEFGSAIFRTSRAPRSLFLNVTTSPSNKKTRNIPRIGLWKNFDVCKWSTERARAWASITPNSHLWLLFPHRGNILKHTPILPNVRKRLCCPVNCLWTINDRLTTNLDALLTTKVSRPSTSACVIYKWKTQRWARESTIYRNAASTHPQLSDREQLRSSISQTQNQTPKTINLQQ